MRFLVVGVAFICTFAGCLESTTGSPWQSLRCDEDGPGRRSIVGANIPPAVTRDHVLRLGEAMGDPVDDLNSWSTRNGVIKAGFDDAAPLGTFLVYEGHRVWQGDSDAAGRAALQTIARELRMPGTYEVRYRSDGGSGTIWQTAADMEIGFTTSLLTWVRADQNGGPFVRFTWRPFLELPEGDPITADEASATATRFADCTMDYHGRTEAAGYRFVSGQLLWNTLYEENGSPYYTVHVKYAHPTSPPCPSETAEPLINVDAWTGAVLRLDWNVCGKYA